MPMSLGSTPTTAKLRSRAMIGSPISLAALRRASSTTAAPSETWLALPAVVEPPGLKMALSLPNPSTVVPARGPSSVLMVTCVLVPSLSLTLVVTGTISLSYKPCFCASKALACEFTASVSCFSRETLYFSATFSDVTPMGIMHAEARSLLPISGLSLFMSKPEVMLYIDIDSTPPARPTSMMPLLMLAAMLATACKPLLHCLLTAHAGISYGKSPKNIAMREVAAPAVGCKTLPIWQSPIFLGSTLVRSTTALKRGASISSQGVSLKPPLPALPMAVRTAQQMTTSSSAGAAPLIDAVGMAARKGAAGAAAAST
mmetsp:Transcript_102340/g.293619  ORF Transcript_102340/g.293619 Transcript_102340/m.293619 type:complete len:315 (+) Transcript_102340:80-1024(+)